MAVAGLFRQLGDAHTRYRPPKCYYQYFNFLNVVPLFGYADSPTSKPTLAIVDPEGVAAGLYPRNQGYENVLTLAKQKFGPKWVNEVRVFFFESFFFSKNFDEQIRDATVLKINKQNGWDYVLNYANDSVGISKSLETRLNLALTKFFYRKTALGMFNARNLNWNPLPPVDALEITHNTTDGVVKTLKYDWFMLR